MLWVAALCVGVFGDRQGHLRTLRDYSPSAVIAAMLYGACEIAPDPDQRHAQTALDSLNDLSRICDVFVRSLRQRLFFKGSGQWINRLRSLSIVFAAYV